MDDFILVKFNSEVAKTATKYYIGNITKNKDEQNDYEVNCLRKCVKSINKCVYPIISDIASFHMSEIVMVLPKPITIIGQTVRQRSSISFGIDLSHFNIE